MQNEFDDHIKKLAGGFKLPPSPQVWDLVEAQLPEKKQRRFIFWWWLPLAFLLVGIGAYLIDGTNKKDKQLSDNKTIFQINKVDENGSINTPVKINKANTIQDKTTIAISKKDFKNQLKENNSGITKINATKGKKAEAIALNNDGNNLLKSKMPYKNDLPIKNNNLANIIIQKEINTIIRNNNLNNKNTDSLTPSKPVDSLMAALGKKEDKKIEKDTSVINKKKNLSTINPIKTKWEIVASLGSANTIGGILGNNNSINSNNFSSPIGPGNPATGVGNSTTSTSLSAPTPNFSFELALKRTQQIAPRLAWYGSFGYSYLSNRQASGALVDSSQIVGNIPSQSSSSDNKNSDHVASYYKDGDSLHHKNYVQLFTVQTGLKYNVSKDFSINGGIAAGYRFSSHWLQPDLNRGILYYSDKLTQKWNIGTQLGFDWQVIKQLSIGVFYNYTFSKTSNASVQQNLHWQSFGATVAVPLSFKK